MKLFGVKLTVAFGALLWLWLLWTILLLIPYRLIGLPFWQSFWGAFVALLLHLVSVYWHDFGHVIAARNTGYPMVGIHLFSVIAATLYPTDEPALPARIHIKRALGGPFASALLSLLALILWWQLADSAIWGNYRDIASLILSFFFLENFVAFTLQLFLPLGFNDGATLWKWLPKLGD